MLATGGDAPRDRDVAPAGGSADTDLLDALVREHRDAAVAYACRILGDPHLAEDAVQRAFLQILLRVRAGDDDLLAANPRAVVLRGTRWAALKIADRHMSRDEAERRAAGEATGDVLEDWDRLEARMLVAHILPSLPVHYRDVLRLRYLEGQPDARAAQRLEVTVKAYRRRLDRALVVARTAAVRIGVSSLGAAVLGLVWRLRDGVRRGGSVAGRVEWSRVEAVVSPTRLSAGHVAVTLAVISLVVGSPLVHAPSHSGGRGAQHSGVVAAGGAPAVAVAPQGAVVAQAPGGASLSQAVSAPHAPALLGGGGFETVSDVVVTNIVVPADYGQNQTVVAEGAGRSCECPVVLQSADGGATWQVARAPGARLLLPPEYPRDPRLVFLEDHAVPGMACVAAHFGDTTCQALGPSVSSQAVIDPHFDSGSPLLYYSTPAGVVAYDVSSSTVKPVTVEPSAASGSTALAGGSVSGPYAFYTLTQGAYAPGDVDSSPVSAAPLAGYTHVVACASGSVQCHTLAVSPLSFASLVVDRDEPRSFLMSNSHQVVVTRDGGATLQTLTAPFGAVFGDVQLVGAGADPVLWTAMAGGTSTLLATWRPGLPAWQRVDVGAYLSAWAALSPSRVLMAKSGAPGLSWSADGGRTWTPACPASR